MKNRKPIASLIAALLILSDLTLGGIVFRDVRPQSYQPQRRLDIMSGQLFSPSLALKKGFYSLNYCASTSARGYSDDNVRLHEETDYVEGVNEHDPELFETFMDYKVTLDKENVYACSRTLNDFQYEGFEYAIRNNYRFKLYVDGLPSAVVVRDPETGEVHNEYDDGIPVGKYVYDLKREESKYILYNHFILTIKESPIDESKKIRIVGFEVEPRSYWPGEEITKDYQKHKPLYLDELKNLDEKDQYFEFTYSQYSILDSTTAWSTRMDHYMKFGSEKVHFTALFLSIGIIIGLVILLNFALDKRVKKDLMNIYKT